MRQTRATIRNLTKALCAREGKDSNVARCCASGGQEVIDKTIGSTHCLANKHRQTDRQSDLKHKLEGVRVLDNELSVGY